MMMSVVDDAVTWHTQTKKIILKIFFSTQRENFPYHTPHEKIFFKRKNFSNLFEITNFLTKEKMSYIYQKKSDQRKNSYNY